MFRKPKILYYSNGQTDKEKKLEKAICHMGIDYVPIIPEHFLQTVGYLAKVKGFPPKKISPLENLPSIPEDVMVLCNFAEENLNLFLRSMRSGEIPSVALKAVLTSQNCFWTFAQLFEELMEEHLRFKERE